MLLCVSNCSRCQKGVRGLLMGEGEEAGGDCVYQIVLCNVKEILRIAELAWPELMLCSNLEIL